MKKGKFITFEGGEGSGKSTQIKALAQRLIEKGIEPVLTREPGGTTAGEAIRDVLVTGDAEKLNAQSEALLNYAARAEHIAHVITPALKSGKWVLCDRFNDSTFAYQGGDVSDTLLQSLDDQIVGTHQPDLTLLMDIDPEIGLRRANNRMETATSNKEDRFEKKGLAYHTAIRDRFLKRANEHRQRVVVLDASLPENELEEIIWKTIQSHYFN